MKARKGSKVEVKIHRPRSEGVEEEAAAEAGVTDAAEPASETASTEAGGQCEERDAAAEAAVIGDGGNEIEALREECRRLEDRWLRARAEMENFRRRSLQDYEQERRRAAERILLPVLDVKDNLEKALASEENRLSQPEGDVGVEAHEGGFFRGIQLIHKQISEILEREGVSPVETAGCPFDPQVHEAVMQVESKEHESDTIVQEFQRGYLLGDRLLRPAKVSVAK